MKRILMMMLLVTAAISANAQWKIGILKRSVSDYDINVKSKYVAYTKNGNGTFSIFDYNDSWYEFGKYSTSYLSNVAFTGFYKAIITDPTDNYVNIRKGAGTNFPVVGKVNVGNEIIFKKTGSNWYQVYGSAPATEKTSDGFLLGVGWEKGTTNTEYYAQYFLGYIYKDRVETCEYWAILEF